MELPLSRWVISWWLSPLLGSLRLSLGLKRNRGILNRGIMSRGIMNRGIVSRGIMNRGIMSRGIMNRGIMIVAF